MHWEKQLVLVPIQYLPVNPLQKILIPREKEFPFLTEKLYQRDYYSCLLLYSFQYTHLLSKFTKNISKRILFVYASKWTFDLLPPALNEFVKTISSNHE